MACVASLAVGLAGGMVAAGLARAMGLATAALALVPALFAGAVLLLWRPDVRRVHVASAVLAGMLAVGGFVWVGPVARWRAEDIGEQRLDLLTLEIVALQLAGQSGLAVRGYENVPPDIRETARQRVAGMSLQARRDLVVEHFGPTLNRARRHESQTPLVWALAAGAVAATPLGLWTLLRRGE